MSEFAAREDARIFRSPSEAIAIVYGDGVVISSIHYGSSQRFTVDDIEEFVTWLAIMGWSEIER